MATRLARLGAQVPKPVQLKDPDHYAARSFYRDIVRLVKSPLLSWKTMSLVEHCSFVWCGASLMADNVA
eukprot:scaffold8986_cov22-Prasinocladus_malaysianus.AAC.2